MKLKLKKWLKNNFKLLPLFCLSISVFIFYVYLSNHSEVAIFSPSKTAAFLLFNICLFSILNIFSYLNYVNKKNMLMLSISIAINILVTVLLFLMFKQYRDNHYYLSLRDTLTESEKSYQRHLKKSDISLYLTILFHLAGFILFIVYASKEKFISKKR